MNVKIIFSKMPGIKATLLLILFFFSALNFKLFAQEEKTAEISLNFEQNDSAKICKAIVTSEGAPVVETEVNFYVKRMYSLLPIESGVATDENGEAIANFPMDLPGDEKGNLTVIAKIEDHEVYGTVEQQSDVKWGYKGETETDHWGQRSLSASRDKAPTILIVASNLIIAVIWGTILYVIFQVYRIKKESQMLKTKND